MLRTPFYDLQYPPIKTQSLSATMFVTLSPSKSHTKKTFGVVGNVLKRGENTVPGGGVFVDSDVMGLRRVKLVFRP